MKEGLTTELYENSNIESTGRRIRRLRRNAGMTQRQLSRCLGISVSYLGAVERDVRPLSRSLAEQLSRHFQLSYDYLITGRHPLPPALLFPDAQRQELSHRLLVLIATCSPEELMAVYQMCSHYLTARRDKAQFRPGARC
ncbi:helix-turn-helix domain-containing protein [Cuneatibacter caecimuris]|uniref:helix-turn-helix domain-containing protein n=1 Tax=Cuneatibacter caecimuris TaxID=1796618 RepID=UPI0024368861|nr:helix-turn-helix transcriptional regulator [Cuneatibacter caecimuris]